MPPFWKGPKEVPKKISKIAHLSGKPPSHKVNKMLSSNGIDWRRKGHGDNNHETGRLRKQSVFRNHTNKT